MSSKINKETIDISKLNINNKLTGGLKKKNKELEPEPESESLSEEDISEESNIDEQVSSEDDRDIDEEEPNDEEEQEEEQETEIEESDKESDADEKTNKESDNESKEDEDNDDNIKDKCYHKYSKGTIDTDIDYDEYFVKDDEMSINKTGRLTKPYLTKYERVRILGDRSRQLAQGAKPMIKNTVGLSHKEVALLELKNKVIPLIIERPIPNVGVEKWKLSELEINL